MNKEEELTLWIKLEEKLSEGIDCLYQLVGDHSVPDDEVKSYLNPYFERSTALKYYASARIKALREG